ncbi:hypothetical protein B0H19DRAFT_1068303 [Mycena capillaripes]|nr:hypothetical protein B0H19DRAFT_1068303 [Mycena capillaripes]
MLSPIIHWLNCEFAVNTGAFEVTINPGRLNDISTGLNHHSFVHARSNEGVSCSGMRTLLGRVARVGGSRTSRTILTVSRSASHQYVYLANSTIGLFTVTFLRQHPISRANGDAVKLYASRRRCSYLPSHKTSFDLSLGTVYTAGRHKVLLHELCSLFYVLSFSVVVSSCSAYPSLRKSPQLVCLQESQQERAEKAADVVLKAAGNKSKFQRR